MGTDAHDPGAEHDLLKVNSEVDFSVILGVRINSHGYPAIHGPKIRARLERELQVVFGPDTAVSEWGDHAWRTSLGATPSSSGPETSATSGSGPNGAQSAKEND